MKKKNFTLKMNGKIIMDVEASGSPEILAVMEKQWFTDTFGIFYKTKDDIAKILLNGIDVKMQTVFRDKKGHFVDLKKSLKTEQK